MTTKPTVGRNIYNQALQRGRNGAESARQALRRLIEDNPGPQTTAMLIAKAALAISEIEAVLSELEEIGRNSKNVDK